MWVVCEVAASSSVGVFFFFNDTATTEIYTLSLHDALPISRSCCAPCRRRRASWSARRSRPSSAWASASTVSTFAPRSEEHTSELQSPCNLVCRLLLEKKNAHLVVPGSLLTPHDDD